MKKLVLALALATAILGSAPALAGSVHRGDSSGSSQINTSLGDKESKTG
jgi:hypothetical protein